MSTIPRDRGLDNSTSLIKEGYKYIMNRRAKFQSDIFKSRVLGESAVCIGGEEATKLFYSDHFTRRNALPKRILSTLMGKKGVQTLTGDTHRDRKEMFLKVTGPDKLDSLKEIANSYWKLFSQKWEHASSLILYTEVRELLTRVVCEWSGVPLNEWEARQRAADLMTMVDSFGGVGKRHFQGKKARKRSEEWIQDIIQQTRDRLISPPENSALRVFALDKDANGDWLDIKVAAVDLLNVLRPTVAITNYILFSALALREFSVTRQRLNDEDQDPSYLEWFVHEVRRYYPFTPYLGARVKEEFEWHEYRFKPGKLVLLDVYGTNHDSRIWNDPSNFRPERFKDWNGSPYNFIPQGGGDHAKDHRCAGEWVTIELMKVAVDFLARKLEYRVLDQDLSYDLSRMPTIPASGFIIRDVKLREKKRASVGRKAESKVE